MAAFATVAFAERVFPKSLHTRIAWRQRLVGPLPVPLSLTCLTPKNCSVADDYRNEPTYYVIR